MPSLPLAEPVRIEKEAEKCNLLNAPSLLFARKRIRRERKNLIASIKTLTLISHFWKTNPRSSLCWYWNRTIPPLRSRSAWIGEKPALSIPASWSIDGVGYHFSISISVSSLRSPPSTDFIAAAAASSDSWSRLPPPPPMVGTVRHCRFQVIWILSKLSFW